MVRFVFLLLSALSLCHCELRVRVSPDHRGGGGGDQSRQSVYRSGGGDGDEDDDGVSNAFGGLDDEEDARRRAEEERERAVYSQLIFANSTTDTVTVELEWSDGTIITQLTDFRAQSQMLRVLMPGEEDLGQPNFQAFCFVSHYSGDLIPPEAVMKLRQKNPGTVRVSDEDRGEVVQDSPLRLRRDKAAVVSSHLHAFCKDARENVLSSEHELFNILESASNDSDGPNSDATAVTKVSDISHEAMKDSEHLPRCFSVEDRRHPCICSLRICIDWYPCALKYCPNKEGEGEHRCGIRTCSKCLTFRYPIKAKNLCMWDEV